VAVFLKHPAVVLDQSVVVPQCSAIDLPIDVGLVLWCCALTLQRCSGKGQDYSVMVEHESLVVHQASMMVYNGLLMVLERLRGVLAPIASRLSMSGLSRLFLWFLHRSSSLSVRKKKEGRSGLFCFVQVGDIECHFVV
jgi:hypothetical protein